MGVRLSKEMQNVITYSREEAIRLGNEQVGPEHLLLGIFRDENSLGIELLNMFKIDIKPLKQKIEDRIKNSDVELRDSDMDKLVYSKIAERIYRFMFIEATTMQSEEVHSGHLLLSLLKIPNSVSQLFDNLGVDYTIAKMNLEQIEPTDSMSDDDDDEESTSESESSKESTSKAKGKTSETPILDSYGVDLTSAAEEGKLDPIVGRDLEIERIAQILSRRKKNNPVLIGEPGVGKSAIVEGLAMRIIQKKVSHILFDKRVITLDMASIVAGTKYRGQFEERMKGILNELSKSNNIILFIDEIHTIVGAGGATGSLDAANMLKPSLARGELQCIGATTLDEYRQYIEKDGALERRFQKVMVEPTNEAETLEILHNIKERYEDHHNVKYTDAAIEACVKLTVRYISDRSLPDKAIDALDESGSRVHIKAINVPELILKLEDEFLQNKQEKLNAVKNQNFEKAAAFRDKEREIENKIEMAKRRWHEDLVKNRETVDEQHVAEVVAMITGVPVQRIAQSEGSKLLNMDMELNGSVIGQNEAVKKVVLSIQRNRAGLKDPNKPIGTFVFLGPTGVGKTQLAKVLARYLFDSEDALIRIDMSEYMEKFSVSRLVGAPPGYVGYEEGGQLTEKVRRKPYSVVLLDEIEKAHPDVFHILLQVLDEGRLTDSLGRRIDFRNTIIIMTSNIGTRQLSEYGKGIGFDTKSHKESYDIRSKSIVENALKKAFAPEFLNRIDDVIMFNSLSKKEIAKIIDLELNGLFKRVKSLGYSIKISPAAKDYIAEKGFDPQFGARPLKRAIQKYIEDAMAEYILRSELKIGETIFVGFNEKSGIKLRILKDSEL